MSPANGLPARIVPPAPRGHTWNSLMLEALALARAAPASGEVPVGALVVSGDGTILARARNTVEGAADPCGHAEILALQAAGRTLGNHRLEGCVLVATLEPCLMCAGALAHARVAGLVYGASDPKAGAVTSCLEALDLPFLNHRVWHMGGVEEEACATILRDFFTVRR